VRTKQNDPCKAGGVLMFGRAGKKKSKVLNLNEYNMRYYIYNGILVSIVTSLFKPYAQKFLYRINGTEAHVFLFNALPGLIAVFTIIPGIIIINRAKNKKNIIAGSFLLSRFFILTLAVVPFLPSAYQPMTFVILISFMNFPDSVSNTALQSFTGDIFQGDNCAIAITDRNKYSSLTNFVVLIFLGVIMKGFSNNAGETIQIYQLFFISAFLLSIFEILSFYKLKQIKCVKPVEINILHTLKEISKDRKFILFMLCSMTFHFGWQMGWPLFNIYQIKDLGADEMWLTILGVTSGIAMFLSFNYWKKLIINKGNSHAITLATTGMAVSPILFALSPNLYILTLMGIATGFFTSGTITVIVSSLLEVAPEKNRDIYFAVHATLTNVTLGVSPFFSGFILKHSNIYIALIVTMFFRFAGSLAFYIRNKRINRINKSERAAFLITISLLLVPGTKSKLIFLLSIFSYF
jgi:hypothetical protein